MDLRRQVGMRARHLREGLGLERSDIAAGSGLSEEMIGKIENGSTGISFDALPPLAAALETSVPDLFAYAGPVGTQTEDDLDRLPLVVRANDFMRNLRREDLEYHVEQLEVTAKHRPRKRRKT